VFWFASGASGLLSRFWDMVIIVVVGAMVIWEIVRVIMLISIQTLCGLADAPGRIEDPRGDCLVACDYCNSSYLLLLTSQTE
jgi:hypothetical protein